MSNTAHIEVTDTFGGESNYSWVLRTEVKASLSRRTLVKHAKALAGWDGLCRVNVTDMGDLIEVRPTASSGVCQVAFITFDY